MAIITISRELGSGGNYLALKVAQALGYACVDKEILNEIALKMERNQEDLKVFDQETYDRMSVFFEEALGAISQSGRVFHRFGLGPLDWTALDLIPSGLDEIPGQQQYVEVLRQVITELAAKGNTVILGRGGQCILGKNPDAFHLRLVGEFSDRIARVREEQKIEEKQARTLIEQRDEGAWKFLQDFFEADWNDAHLYHLTLNTSLIPLEKCLQIVLKALEASRK